MSKPYSSVYNTHKKNLTENIQMADTYTQLYIHIVFSVKGRQPLIPKQHKAELHKYITGIVTNKMQKMIQINSMPDHTHIFIGITPDIAYLGFGQRHQEKRHTIHQSKTMDRRKIHVAGRIRRIQLLTFPTKRGHRLH